MRRAPPPSGSAPQMGLEALEVVKRKVSAPPRGPPPAGMTVNFKGPRQVDRQQSYRDAKNDRSYDDDRNDDPYYDDREDSRYRDEQNDSRDYNDRDLNRRDDASPVRRDSRDQYYSDEDNYDRDRSYNDDLDDSYYDDRDNRRDDNMDHDRVRNFDKQDDRYGEPNAYADGKDNNGDHQHHHRNQNGSGESTLVKAKAPPVTDAKASAHSDSSSSQSASQPAASAVAVGKKSAIFNFQPILKSTYRELRHFVLSPCQPGVIVRCYIERNRSGAKMLAPFYSLCADLEDGTGRELAVCRKVWQSRTSHYVFSLKSEDLWRKREQRSRLYLGKLRSTGHGEYVLYDNGICAAPEEDESILQDIEDFPSGAVHSNVGNTNIARKLDRDRAAEAKNAGAKSGAGDDVSLYRREMAVIKFNAMNRPAPQCVRGLEVCIPAVPSPAAMAEAKQQGAAGAATVIHSSTPTVFNLEKPFKKIRDMGRQNDLYSKSCLVLHEKTSRYDPLSACLVEFKHRAHMASIKNFQMVVSEPQAQFGLPSPATHEQMLRVDSDKDFVFLMGKTTEDCFNMDFKYPLSLFQAFAIAIARFDAKLSW